jgi:hypothetical protein
VCINVHTCWHMCFFVQNCATNSPEHAHIAHVKDLGPNMNRKGDWERQLLNVHRRREGLSQATKLIAGMVWFVHKCRHWCLLRLFFSLFCLIQSIGTTIQTKMTMMSRRPKTPFYTEVMPKFDIPCAQFDTSVFSNAFVDTYVYF